jgi:hypothetical protein
MTTEIALPLVTAVVSLAISMMTLGWTIYRDAVRRPKFRTSIAIKTIRQAGRAPDGPHIFVEALNMGPIPNRIGLVFAHKSWWQRKIKRAQGAFIYPNWAHPATTRSASRIEVGDTAVFVFPYDEDCFLKHDFAKVGVSDGFGSMHWATRKQLLKAQEDHRKRFQVARAAAGPVVAAAGA